MAVRSTHTPFALRTYGVDQWQERARQLKQQILTSAGLSPFPKKAPLRPHVLGRHERDGYVIENVYLETLPGLLLCGNLFRPTGAPSKVPGVLCPHGHFGYGRLQPGESSDLTRCQDLARQGYVAFTYDMIGFNDTWPFGHWGLDRSRSEAPGPSHMYLESGDGAWEKLWGISLMGLQLWNSLRALDYLATRPEVDAERLAYTGASGGATQGFLLAAIDDRVKVSVPVCMVSAGFQGGCVCENSPGLRLDTCNVELAALTAPRPQLLVSATGDWTKDTPEVEYPWMREIYRLFGAEDRLAYSHHEAGHNYDEQSRAITYRWLARWMLGIEGNEFEEFLRARAGDPGEGLLDPSRTLVFFGRPQPPGLGPEVVTKHLVQRSREQLKACWPATKSGLARFRKIYGPAYQSALAASLPAAGEVVCKRSRSQEKAGMLAIRRKEEASSLAVFLLPPAAPASGLGILVAGGKTTFTDGRLRLDPVASRLARAGHTVLALQAPLIMAGSDLAREQADPFLWTYNRTQAAESVQGLLTALAALSDLPGVSRLALVGLQGAGLSSLLARALALHVESCLADFEFFNPDDDEEFLNRLYVPLLRRVGDLRTALTLAAPGRLFLYSTGDSFRPRWLRTLYGNVGHADQLRLEAGRVAAAELTSFLTAKNS